MSWRRGNTAQVPYQTPSYTIEYIYFELNHRWSHPKSWLYDQPFPAWSEWPINLQERYQLAEKLVGRETLIISIHSVQFRVSLENYTNKDWNQLLDLLAPMCGSLRMFALSRNIRYHESYNESTLAAAIGHLPQSEYADMPPVSHPHELYLAADGQEIERSYFTHVNGTRYPMQTITSNIYKPSNFYRDPRPASWPDYWLYPHAPNDPVRDPHSGHYPLCTYCKQETRAKGFGPRCTCRTHTLFRRPLVEIIQYPSYPGSEGSLNRGVRLLEDIAEGDVLDEYVGEYIPLPTHSVLQAFGDMVYTFSCHGPPIVGEDGEGEGEEMHNDEGWENAGYICGLKAGERGNWTRFINHMDGEQANCQFETHVAAGKVRILVVANRDLHMGEELCADYGPNYFA
ncbi:hypothetical protein SBOR_3587 [Sclerotinia borealis F-4128]|uniref:SET domain-containing protein n=1 Tax=Sclerotinia borealis (strain F-4128) TaxID=1432307 RepID=W9CMY5_SCLBF|nr:hypothetical protein SBOR_3587 [Sclerotinia borealis F-4128]